MVVITSVWFYAVHILFSATDIQEIIWPLDVRVQVHVVSFFFQILCAVCVLLRFNIYILY